MIIEKIESKKTYSFTVAKKMDGLLFTFVMVLAILNVFSPLRLNTDSVRYLNILEYLNGYLSNNSIAAHDFYPVGYPRFIQSLDKIHILNSFSITFINILAVTTSGYLLAIVFEIERKLLFLSFLLLSFINIKHFSLPIADHLYLLPFTISIYSFSKVFKGNYKFIVPAIIFAFLSIYLRTAGIVIFSGVIFYILYMKKHYVFSNKYILGLLILVVAASTIFFGLKLPLLEQKVSYIKQLEINSMLQHPITIIERLCIHFKEIGEFMINLPASKVESSILKAYNISDYIFIFIGLITFIAIGRIVFVHRLYKHFAFWVFFSYCSMIFLWPFYDPRFLIPLIPALIYLVIPYLNTFIKQGSATIIHTIIFVSFGFISMLYSNAMSLNKGFFLKHYGTSLELTNQYKMHFDKAEKRPAEPNLELDKNRELYLLDKYDK